MELEEGIARSAQPAAQGAERHRAGPASKFVIGALSVHPAQRRPCGRRLLHVLYCNGAYMYVIVALFLGVALGAAAVLSFSSTGTLDACASL